MNVELKIQQFVVASFQSAAQGLKKLPVSAGQASLLASQGQGGSSIPSHALVVLRTVTGSLWALWMAKERREEMCRAVLMWSVGPVLEGWNSLFTKDTAWGSSKLFLTSTFLFYPNYPGFVVYIPAPAVSGVGGCALDGLLVPSGISISCPCPAPCWGCAPSSVSLAQVDKLYPCSAQHPVSITACVEFLRRV